MFNHVFRALLLRSTNTLHLRESTPLAVAKNGATSGSETKGLRGEKQKIHARTN